MSHLNTLQIDERGRVCEVIDPGPDFDLVDVVYGHADTIDTGDVPQHHRARLLVLLSDWADRNSWNREADERHAYRLAIGV